MFLCTYKILLAWSFCLLTQRATAACSINCKKCTSVCKDCHDGYHFESDVCVLNKNNCSNGCSSDCSVDGICLGSCIEGWTGDRCSDTCASPCTKCDKNNATICEDKASTQPTVCNKCYDEDNCYTIMSFVTGYMSGIGTSVFVVAISIVVYRIIQRSFAKKPNNDNQGNSTAEMSTHYNEHAAQNHEPEQVINEENNYESLSNSRNTDAVYKGMEVQEVQQGQGYYNIDAIN